MCNTVAEKRYYIKRIPSGTLMRWLIIMIMMILHGFYQSCQSTRRFYRYDICVFIPFDYEIWDTRNNQRIGRLRLQSVSRYSSPILLTIYVTDVKHNQPRICTHQSTKRIRRQTNINDVFFKTFILFKFSKKKLVA